MAHPFHRHRAHMVARSRAHEIAGGGSVHSDVAADRKLIRESVKASALKRARGGRTGPIDININTGSAPSAPLGAPVGAPPPVPPGMAPSMPPAPRPPGLGPPPGPPLGPPPMRARGGRAVKREGGANTGRAWEQSIRGGTPMQHSPDLTTSHGIVEPRGKPITYRKGGRVHKRATGGPLEAPPTSHSPKLPGGSGGGLARLAKAHRASHRSS